MFGFKEPSDIEKSNKKTAEYIVDSFNSFLTSNDEIIEITESGE